MLGKRKATTKDKLVTDLFNHLAKPLALVLLDPISRIIFFSITLFFSIKHNLAHIKRAKTKPGYEQNKAHRKGKIAWITARLIFDFLGLGLSIILLIASVTFLGRYIQSFADATVLISIICLTASSVTSTLFKGYRFFKKDYTWNYPDVGRALFGALGSVFLGCLAFHQIPSFIMSNPFITFGVGGGFILILAVFKIKKAWAENKKLEAEHQALDAIPDDASLSDLIRLSKDPLLMLRKVDDNEYPDLLQAQVESLFEKIKADPNSAETQKEALRDFFDSFDILELELKDLIIEKYPEGNTELTTFITQVFAQAPRQEASAPVEQVTSDSVIKLKLFSSSTEDRDRDATEDERQRLLPPFLRGKNDTELPEFLRKEKTASPVL